MDFLDKLEARAAEAGGRVALAEGHDPRVIEAAADLAARGPFKVTVVCPGDDRGPDWRSLDVAILHRGIVGNLMGLGEDTSFTYKKDAAAVLAAVDGGDFGLGFVLKPTTTEQLRACAEAGEAMPHKSTYFFPKLPTGTVIYRLV